MKKITEQHAREEALQILIDAHNENVDRSERMATFTKELDELQLKQVKVIRELSRMGNNPHEAGVRNYNHGFMDRVTALYGQENGEEAQPGHRMISGPDEKRLSDS